MKRSKADRLSNPPESAGHLAVTAVPTGIAEESLGSVRDRIMAQRHEALDLVVVVDRDQRYLGAADLRDVMVGDADTALLAIMKPDWPHVSPQTDQEHAAEAATKAGVGALPVVSADGRVYGCVPAATLLSVLSREHHEDMHRLAGILRERSDAVHAIDAPPLQRVIPRLPWLLVGLALSAVAALVMASYEQALQANVTIAFFIPSLVYLTDAIGTQTETVAVRGLSLRRRPLPRLLLYEVAAGSLMGLALGVFALFGIWAIFADFWVALGVGVSLLAAGTLASAIGLLLPWSLSRVNIDPAFGSGPVATIIQDVLTILLYFFVMTTLLQ